MAIWEYPATEQMGQRVSWFLKKVRYTWKCPFCLSIDLVRWINNKYSVYVSHGKPDWSPLDAMIEAFNLGEAYTRSDTNIYVLACPSCGWWCAVSTNDTLRVEDFDFAPSPLRIVKGTIGNLAKLSGNNLSEQILEAKQYLIEKFNSARSEIDPRVFEHVVASILKDMGFRTRVTGYSNDGGIDIILDGPENSTVGVQVKRYKNSIQVEQIRALAGALVLKGYTKGVFVTTSEFQSGGTSVIDMASNIGLGVELVNSKQFLEALNINTRRMYESHEELLEKYKDQLIYLEEYEVETKDPKEAIWF